MLSGYKKPLNIAIFISGSGSTLQAMLEMQHLFKVSLVVANKKDALGILKAKRFGAPVFIFDKTVDYVTLDKILEINKIQRIFLAGYMKIIPESFVNKWQNRILNIHPSLLPEFPGLNSLEHSWRNKKSMGVTIHKVIPEMDAGEKILQMKSLFEVKDFSLDDAALLLRRTEQHLLREVIQRFYL